MIGLQTPLPIIYHRLFQSFKSLLCPFFLHLSETVADISQQLGQEQKGVRPTVSNFFYEQGILGSGEVGLDSRVAFILFAVLIFPPHVSS